MKEHFLSLANYNAWANERLYEAVEHLPEGAWSAPREAAFFTSIRGTLNHILLADRAWMDRLEGHPPRFSSLDEMLHDDFESLRADRKLEDRRILSYCDELKQSSLLNDIEYRTVGGQQMVTRHDRILTHLFNHQTHHRGQAHALILEAGAEPPPLDYIYYLRSLG
ncbi:DinB family protein [Limibacillus halophilus]